MQCRLFRTAAALAACVLTLAAGAPARAADPAPCRVDDLSVVPRPAAAGSAPYGLGAALQVRVANDCAARLRDEYRQGAERIQLRVGGVRLARVPLQDAAVSAR